MNARRFRDTVPKGLMDRGLLESGLMESGLMETGPKETGFRQGGLLTGLPQLQVVTVTAQDARSREDGADPLMGATERPLPQPVQGALLLPGLAKALMAVTAAAAASFTLLLLVLGAAKDSSAAAGLLSVPWALLVVAAAACMRVPLLQQWRALTGTLVCMALLVAV